MKPTDFIVKASLDKLIILLKLTRSGKYPITLEHGRILKPLEVVKESANQSLKISEGDLIFLIGGIEKKDIRKRKKIFVSGEFVRGLELTKGKGSSFITDQIELLSAGSFFRQLAHKAIMEAADLKKG